MGCTEATGMLGKKCWFQRGLHWGSLSRAQGLLGGVASPQEGGQGHCGQMSRGLTMVKPESLLLLLLSSSGLELGLLEEAEAGPIRGSENTRGERTRGSLLPEVLRRVRRGWAWPEKDPLALPPSSSLETRMKSSALPLSTLPGVSGEACEVQSEVQVGERRLQ